MTRAPRPPRESLRVLVVAEHALVGQSVGAALRILGLDAAVVGGDREIDRCEVGLLITTSTFGWALAAMVIRTGAAVPWLVLAPEGPGPDWDACYESGATLVLAPDTTLEAVVGLLHDLAGRSVIRSGATL